MLDKSEKKRLAKQYAALTQKVGRVLKRFTPIDPLDDDSIGDEYEDAVPYLVSILIRGGGCTELQAVLERTRSQFGLPPDPEKDQKIAEAVIKSLTSGRKEPPANPCYRLDLSADVNPVNEFLEQRVKSFAPNENPGPGAAGEITSIVIGFECSQSGWLSVVFDLREGSQPDGEWTLYLDRANVCIERVGWRQASAANMRGPIEVVELDGKRRYYPIEEAPLPEAIGKMLKSTVMDFHNRGGFSTLPLAPDCYWYIENYDGLYAWPEADDPSRFVRDSGE